MADRGFRVWGVWGFSRFSGPRLRIWGERFGF